MAFSNNYVYGFTDYVSVAERRQQAARELAKLTKKGRQTSPVTIDGRKIATTFWGKAWCDNLERYSDYANRLPRGRSYVRNGTVVDLQIAPGVVTALVSGSELYTVKIDVGSVARSRWQLIRKDCSGAIDSAIELLQGRLSDAVMARLCDQKTGLFPSPADIGFSCSCPDWASMCKHVAAVLYGIGARLDHPSGGDGTDLHVRAHHDQAVAALRRLEFDIGDLPSLHAASQRQSARRCQDCCTPCHGHLPTQARHYAGRRGNIQVTQ